MKSSSFELRSHASAMAMIAVAIGALAIGNCKPPVRTEKSDRLPVRRTIVDNQGRPLQVMILSKREGFIAAKRISDSATFSIAISDLSADDQAYLTSLPESSLEAVAVAAASQDMTPLVDPGRRAFWNTSFDSAVEDSAETSLPILMIFVGSTWSEPCKHLESVILRDQRFIDFANRNLVLMKVDVPRRGAGGPQGKLVQKFGVKSVPTIMLIRDGIKPAARVKGYSGADVDAMIKFVRTAGQ